MSSYFDNAAREVAENFDRIKDVEARVIREVNLVTGDREFPEDLRKVIQATIAKWRYEPIYESIITGLQTEGKEMSDCLKQSVLIERLHSDFHTLGSRHIVCRFGRLSDSPSRILAQRDNYINGGRRN